MDSSKKDLNLLKAVRRIIAITVMAIILLAISSSVVGCAEPESIRVKAAWITASSSLDSISIPLNEVTENGIVHFPIETESNGKMAFMAYELDNSIYVRSNVCPPCRSIGFSLQGNTLICDTCSTTFNAETGDGIKGACVDFPKEPVDYKVVDDSIIMNTADMVDSYQNTLRSGW